MSAENEVAAPPEADQPKPEAQHEAQPEPGSKHVDSPAELTWDMTLNTGMVRITGPYFDINEARKCVEKTNVGSKFISGESVNPAIRPEPK